MRIAILSDIHGNSVALQAALDDIEARGSVDEFWILGDLCAIGYDPIRVLEQLTELPNCIFIKGNADRYVSSFDLPPPSIEDATLDNNKINVLAEVFANFSWTRGALDITGWTSWLRDLPFEHRLCLPDGTEVLLVHSQPGSDEDKGLNPSLTDDEVGDILQGINVRLVCVGHFHLPMHRHFHDMQIINPGSVGTTFMSQGKSHYALLDASDTGFDIKFYGVPYDVDRAIDIVRQTFNVGNDYNIRMMLDKSDVMPSWGKVWDKVSHRPTIEPLFAEE